MELVGTYLDAGVNYEHGHKLCDVCLADYQKYFFSFFFPTDSERVRQHWKPLGIKVK